MVLGLKFQGIKQVCKIKGHITVYDLLPLETIQIR